MQGIEKTKQLQVKNQPRIIYSRVMARLARLKNFQFQTGASENKPLRHARLSKIPKIFS